MNHPLSTAPSYVKLSLFFIGLCAFGCILYFSQFVLIPFVFAALFASLLDPIVTFFERIKIPRLMAIALCVILAFLCFCAVAYFIFDQLSLFIDSLPKFSEKIGIMIEQLKEGISSFFHIRHEAVDAQFKKWAKLFDQLDVAIGYLSGFAISAAFTWLFMPAYVFLILYSQPLIWTFIKKISDRKNLGEISDAILAIKAVVQSYLIGLVIEAIIVACLNSTALLILGIDYAIAIGVIGAILNMIPYIGGIFSVIIPILIAILTKDPITTPLLITTAYVIIQFIDNHFIVTFIVASRVRINPLVSVIAVIIFGQMFGVAGMFLALPITGILKIVFDRIDVLAPYGMLLGTEGLRKPKRSSP